MIDLMHAVASPPAHLAKGIALDPESRFDLTKSSMSWPYSALSTFLFSQTPPSVPACQTLVFVRARAEGLFVLGRIVTPTSFGIVSGEGFV